MAPRKQNKSATQPVDQFNAFQTAFTAFKTAVDGLDLAKVSAAERAAELATTLRTLTGSDKRADWLTKVYMLIPGWPKNSKGAFASAKAVRTGKVPANDACRGYAPTVEAFQMQCTLNNLGKTAQRAAGSRTGKAQAFPRKQVEHALSLLKSTAPLKGNAAKRKDAIRNDVTPQMLRAAFESIEKYFGLSVQ